MNSANSMGKNMKILLVGASGTIGSAVAQQFEDRHEIIKASRSGDIRIDLSDPKSIIKMYEQVDRVDAVISAAGDGAFGALDQLTDEDFQYSLGNKLMGQINLVRFGREHVNDRGSFTITSGILAHQPGPKTVLITVLNAGVEAFAQAMAPQMPRGQRINVVCPPLVKETAEKMGFAGGVPAAEVAQDYVRAVEGDANGEMIGPLH
jgi:NAD(P)-dependent dehydrogenase (short-subunit alcohol dehydrogenase family)